MSEQDKIDRDGGAPADDRPMSTVEDDSTVGTGSAIALGCIAGTLLLIVIGLVWLAAVALLR